MAIAVPVEQDAALLSQALAAGNRGFAEKPLALRYDEEATLVAEAERRGLTLMVGHLLPYHRPFIRMRELVRQGVAGGGCSITNRLNFGKVRYELNFMKLCAACVAMILGLAVEAPTTVHTKGPSPNCRPFAKNIAQSVTHMLQKDAKSKPIASRQVLTATRPIRSTASEPNRERTPGRL